MIELEENIFAKCENLKSATILGPVKVLKGLFDDCTSLETVTLGAGIKKINGDLFHSCTSLKTINVPAKKADYYKKRLPEALHGLIVEMPVEKKAKKK